jgi:hypothetical protein
MFKLFVFVLISLSIFAKDPAKIKLKLGESYISPEFPLKISLKNFHTTKTECAVPGFNCGSGYTPDPVTIPVIDFIQTSPECTKSPRPRECEWTFKIIATDNKTFVDVEILNIYDFCMNDANKSNRNSCILRTTVGNHFNPMYNPDNCNKADDPEVKNNCFEIMAENLDDLNLCKKVTGPYGRRCVLLVAIAAGDPEICNLLLTSPMNPSELNERQLYLSRCREKIKELKGNKE